MTAKPIRLTPQGDILEPENFDDKTKIQAPICIGRHKTCRGEIHLIPTTERLAVLVCLKCFLRVSVPRTSSTLEEIREWTEKRVV